MRRGRANRYWRSGALAMGLLGATARGQSPTLVPPSGPAFLAAGAGGPSGVWTPGKTFRDTFIGRPNDFAEPPVGFYIREQFSLMRMKADHHRFMLYRSDFLVGTDQLSLAGASRFNLMASRLPGWLGPVVIEWVPENPGLAEARRAAVVAMLQKTGRPVIPERVLIGPSPFPGTLGADANTYYNVMLSRDQQAPTQLPPSPVSSSGFGVGGGGGTP